MSKILVSVSAKSKDTRKDHIPLGERRKRIRANNELAKAKREHIYHTKMAKHHAAKRDQHETKAQDYLDIDESKKSNKHMEHASNNHKMHEYHKAEAKRLAKLIK